MVPFLKFTRLYLIISFLIIGSGIFSFFHWGFNYSIDFVGGTNLQYELSKDIPRNKLQTILHKQGIKIFDIRQQGRIVYIKTTALRDREEEKIKKTLEEELDIKIQIQKSETVGPTIGSETIRKTAIACLLAVVGILLYISYAFRNINFAVAAIVALVHDGLVVIGSYSFLSHFFGAEVDTLFITALLTTMSFSVHDTIVVFDRIRELRRLRDSRNIKQDANQALTETLVRSLNNSMTIVFMLLALVLLGGETTRFFAATLLIGTITGTYSSPFVATPIAVWLEKRRNNTK